MVEILIYYIDVAVVQFPSECVAQVHEQRLLLWNAAAFLLTHQIPAVVRIILYKSQIIDDADDIYPDAACVFGS